MINDDVLMHDRQEFDPNKLHQKYLEERDKRLRSDGNEQYVDVVGKMRDLAVDPYVEPGFMRDPVVQDIDIAIFGGGFAGLMTAVDLRKSGIEDMRIIEQGGDFGGTWYWNRYPGVRCDIEAYIYMPLLEEVGTIPTEKYATGREIFEHCRALGRHFGLYDRTLFQTNVTDVHWDEDASRWIIRTNRDDEIRARFVVAANGSMHKPKLPGIPGLECFKGKAFHTSRWDYDYTGGDANGNLTGLRDKRVAIIGSGATAIQVLPIVAEHAKHLYMFQRTPSAVDARNNGKTDVAWFKSLKPAWQKRRMDNFLETIMGVCEEDDMINDRWTQVWSRLNGAHRLIHDNIENTDPGEIRQMVDYEAMEHIRLRIDEVVKDKATAEALKPWYNFLCKRPLYSDHYLESFNRPNVSLVDTQGRGVERITENALDFDGKSYEVDCVVFATGFRVGAYIFDGGEYELTGRNGLTLRDKWADGVKSLHGIHSHGFPNFFIVGGYAQASAGLNYSNISGPQATYVATLISQGLRRGVRSMEVSEAGEAGWARKMAEKHVDHSKFETECTPGYYNNEGSKHGGPSLWSGLYGGGPIEYVQVIDAWLKTDVDKDMNITF